MKKNKCLSIIAAGLLAVAPMATVGSTIVENHVVKADSASADETVDLKVTLKKPYITLTKGKFWDTDNIKNLLKPNHGKIELVSSDLATFKKGKDGKIKWNNPVYENDLKNGDEGIVIAKVELEHLDKDVNYSYDTKVDDSGDLVNVVTPSNDGNTYYDKDLAVKIPFVVGSKKTTKKAKYRRGYITGRYNRRVRTYTSRSKFAHKYVYGGHNYKFNTRKVIKGKVYYKLYGKKQYVRASYIEF